MEIVIIMQVAAVVEHTMPQEAPVAKVAVEVAEPMQHILEVPVVLVAEIQEEREVALQQLEVMVEQIPVVAVALVVEAKLLTEVLVDQE
jgi:hypothetical protein